MKNEGFASLFASIVVAIPVLWLCYMFDANECHAKWYNVGETQYSLMGGCQVKIKDQFVPADSVRIEK